MLSSALTLDISMDDAGLVNPFNGFRNLTQDGDDPSFIEAAGRCWLHLLGVSIGREGVLNVDVPTWRRFRRHRTL